MLKLSGFSIVVFVGVLACVPYVWNAYKLTQCDFIASYKCEVIHSIGVVVPPAAYVTVWFSDDS